MYTVWSDKNFEGWFPLTWDSDNWAVICIIRLTAHGFHQKLTTSGTVGMSTFSRIGIFLGDLMPSTSAMITYLYGGPVWAIYQAKFQVYSVFEESRLPPKLKYL